MLQPGEGLVQRELAWFEERRYGTVLGKRGASLGPAAPIAFPPYPRRDLPPGRGSQPSG